MNTFKTLFNLSMLLDESSVFYELHQTPAKMESLLLAYSI